MAKVKKQKTPEQAREEYEQARQAAIAYFERESEKEKLKTKVLKDGTASFNKPNPY